MKASLFYRIAAVLLLLFAVGHTLGFRQTDPAWGADSLVSLMRSIQIPLQGFNRTYWDLFSGLGFFNTFFLLFAAVLAWQLGALPRDVLSRLRGTAWAFAICFAAITAMSFRFLFTAPIVFCGLITLCLVAGAWLSAP